MSADSTTPNAERDEVRKQMEAALSGGAGPKLARFALAFLGGAVPFVGGAMSGAAGVWSESNQEHFNRILAAWLQLQERELIEIALTLREVVARLDMDDAKIQERIQ